MRISDWSSDVCSSDLSHDPGLDRQRGAADDEREGGGDAAQRHAGPEGSIGKLAIAEQAQRLRNLHVDLLGASGTGYASYEMTRPERFGSDSPQRSFLRSRATTIEGGTSEVMRNIDRKSTRLNSSH